LHRRGHLPQPCARRLDQIAGRHHRVNGAELQCIERRDMLAPQHESERCLSADEAWKPLGAAASRKKSDPRFGKAELRLFVIGGNAVMAGKRQFESAAKTGAVDRAHDRLSAGLKAAAET